MRGGFVALMNREARDARWHLVASFAFAVAVPICVHGWWLAGALDAMHAKIGARVLVPIVFGLFVAATASELVARDVATKRIDALAVLPVPIARVWTAKALFLAVASLAFLACLATTELASLVAFVGPTVRPWLSEELRASVPSLFLAVAFGGASLFFSTLLERGMAAVLASVVALVAIGCAVQWTAPPAAPGAFVYGAAIVAPTALAAAFVFGSRAAFVRGPIHAAGKPRVAFLAFAALVAIAVPSGAALAIGLERTTHLDAGAGDPARRRAFLSPDGKWIAVEDSVEDGARRTWIVSVADGSCRPVHDGTTWFPWNGPWLAESSLRVAAASFSLLDGPCCARQLDIEPTRLDVAEESASCGYDPRLERADRPVACAGPLHVLADGDVTLATKDGATRVVFPPRKEK